ncbi:MAG: hypothetical protein ABEN55_09085 [Bradymonadaceae bacterium]
METMDETRIIATFDSPDDAETAADRLRQADIDVDLEEAAQIGGDALMAGDSAGTALRISRGEEDRAREVLGDTHDEALAPEIDEDADDPFSDTDPAEEEEWEEITEGLHCPECHSKDLGLGTPVFQGIVAAIVVTSVAVFLVPEPIATWAMGAWSLLLVILLIGLGLRRFPLVCKECGYTGPRHAFDPTTES